MSYHKIPNMALGKVISRHVVRIFFPHMFKEHTVTPISPEMLGRIYNEAVRPAVHSVSPMAVSRWPITYALAIAGSRHHHTGLLSFGSIDIDNMDLEEFAKQLLANLDTIPECRDAYFLHEIRGVKGHAPHNPNVREERWDALNHIFEAVERDALDVDVWRVDVALEYGKAGYVMQWLKQSHLAIVRDMLPSGVTDERYTLLMNGSGFSLDLAAQLGDLAGFRLLVPTSFLVDEKEWIVAYTTEKAQTAHLTPGAFRTHYASELVGGRMAKLIKDVAEMAELYAACRGQWDPESGGPDPNSSAPGNARLEVRVKLRHAADCLTGLSAQLVASSTVAVPCWSWW